MSNTGNSGLTHSGQLEYINRRYLNLCELCEELNKERNELKQHLRETQFDLNSTLSERDIMIRENQSLFDKNDALKKELDKVAKSKEEYMKECDALRQKNLEFVRNRNEYMQSNDDLISDKDRMAYLSIEVANQEIEKLKKLVERGKMDVARANQEVEIAKGRRDWAISEREKIVQERDSMRNLCDELRKERDTSTSRLLSAIRDKDEAISKIEFLNEKIETTSKRLKAAESKNLKTSNVDYEEEIEVNVSHLLVNADLGLTLQCNPESTEYNNNNSYPKVVHVESDSIFMGKLFRGDNIQYVNGIDCSTLSQRMLFKTIRTSAPTCKMTVRRAKQYEKEVYNVKLKNIKNCGLSFDVGVYIRDIKVNSQAYFEPLMFEGDRVLQINNQIIEKSIRNYDDLNDLLMKIEGDENIQMKLERTFSVNRGTTSQQQINNRWSKMINSSTQTVGDRNSSVPGYNSETVPFKPTPDIHDQESSSNYSNASLPSPNSSKSLSKFSGSYIIQKLKKIRKTNKEAHENDALAVLDSILDSQDSWDKDKKKNKYKKMIAKSWPREAINTNVSENSQSGTIVFKRNKERPRLFSIDSEGQNSNNDIGVKDCSKEEIEHQMVNKLFTPPVPHPQYPIHSFSSKRSSINQQAFQQNVQTFDSRRSAEKRLTYVENLDLKRRSLNFSAYSGMRSNFHRNSFTPIKPVSTTSSNTPFEDIHNSSLSTEKYLIKNEHKFDDLDKNSSMDSTFNHKSLSRNMTIVPDDSRNFQHVVLPYTNDMSYIKQYPSPIMFPQHEVSTPNTSSNLYSSIRSSQNSSTDGSLSFEKMKLQDSKEEVSASRGTPQSFSDIGTFPRKNIVQKLVKTSNNSLDYSAERSSPLPKFQIQVIRNGKNSMLNNRSSIIPPGECYKPNIGEKRRVHIDKSEKPLGISIKCKKGVFVSQVTENSIASQVGLQIGDQLLEFCGINMRSATYEIAAKFLRQSGNSITMLVQYNPLKYEENSGSDEDSTPQNSPKAMRSMMSEDSLQEFKRDMCISSHLQPLVLNGTLKKSNPNSKMLSETITIGKEQPRVIYIETKKTHNLGVSLLGGNAYGIFIHSVQKGSLADEAGLRIGDQILEYNGTDLRHSTAEQAARELAKPNDRVAAIVQYNIQKFNQIKDKPGDSFYIKVGFDRNAEGNDSYLSFNKDEVLYVDNTMFQGVAGQWKAWKLDEDGYRLHCGIIPSQMKVEEELRLSGDPSCLEVDSSNRRNSNSSARRSFFRRIKPQRGSTRDSKELASFNNTHLSLFLDSQSMEDGLSSYQRVERLDYKFRPILVTGALTDWVVEKLIIDFPEQFRRCNVSRLKCSKEEIESQLKDNTILEYRKRGSLFELVTLQAVKENLESHCILDVNLSTIERLHKNNIYPIVVLLKFKSWKQIKEIKDPRSENTTLSSKQAKEMYEFALKIESEYKNYISVVIQGVNITHMSTQIKTAVDSEQRKILWVPDKEN